MARRAGVFSDFVSWNRGRQPYDEDAMHARTCWLGSTGFQVATPPLDVESAFPKLRILVINAAGIPPLDMLLQAHAENTRIYSGAGVNLLWSDPLNSIARLTMLIISNPNAWLNRVPIDALGLAPGTDGDPGRLAYAFYDRIQTSAKHHQTNAATLLGYVMAHELGHLLTVRSHSSEGIMRNNYGQFQMNIIDAHVLRFTASDAKVIRLAVTEMNAALLSLR